MPKRRQPYTLIYARQAVDHLKSIDAKYDRLILQTIQEQLTLDPGIATRNRKPLRPMAAFAAKWEIRFGPDNRFRVLYDIDEKARTVEILAIGVKEGNRLIIGGDEVKI